MLYEKYFVVSTISKYCYNLFSKSIPVCGYEYESRDCTICLMGTSFFYR